MPVYGFPTSTSFSESGQWKLKAGSAGMGTGGAGTDIGMFWRPGPYRLSGIPPIPTFFRLSAPTILATQNPFTITFSVRGNRLNSPFFLAGRTPAFFHPKTALL